MEGKEVMIMVRRHIRDRIDELESEIKSELIDEIVIERGNPYRIRELKKLLEWLNGLEV